MLRIIRPMCAQASRELVEAGLDEGEKLAEVFLEWLGTLSAGDARGSGIDFSSRFVRLHAQ